MLNSLVCTSSTKTARGRKSGVADCIKQLWKKRPQFLLYFIFWEGAVDNEKGQMGQDALIDFKTDWLWYSMNIIPCLGSKHLPRARGYIKLFYYHSSARNRQCDQSFWFTCPSGMRIGISITSWLHTHTHTHTHPRTHPRTHTHTHTHTHHSRVKGQTNPTLCCAPR